jgi:hypothetical protein
MADTTNTQLCGAMGCSIWIRVALMASLKENRQFTVSSHISVIAAKVTCPQV